MKSGSKFSVAEMMVNMKARIFTASLAAFLCTAQADDEHYVQGLLEIGPSHSAIWYVGAESGDVAGFLFDNFAPVGKMVLQNCLPAMFCAVDKAVLEEFSLLDASHLPTAEHASAMFLIETAQAAYMVSQFELDSIHLSSRFGTLAIDDEQRLTFNTRPVMARVQGVEVLTQEEYDQETLYFWQRWLKSIKRDWFGIEEEELHVELRTRSIGVFKQEAVQGDERLRMVEHFENDSVDWVVLMSMGGRACPAMFRVVSLTSAGATSTPEFGACSDLIRINWLAEERQGLSFAMVPLHAPEETSYEQLSAATRLTHFVFENGHVREERR